MIVDVFGAVPAAPTASVAFLASCRSPVRSYNYGPRQTLQQSWCDSHVKIQIREAVLGADKPTIGAAQSGLPMRSRHRRARTAQRISVAARCSSKERPTPSRHTTFNHTPICRRDAAARSFCRGISCVDAIVSKVEASSFRARRSSLTSYFRCT